MNIRSAKSANRRTKFNRALLGYDMSEEDMEWFNICDMMNDSVKHGYFEINITNIYPRNAERLLRKGYTVTIATDGCARITWDAKPETLPDKEPVQETIASYCPNCCTGDYEKWYLHSILYKINGDEFYHAPVEMNFCPICGHVLIETIQEPKETSPHQEIEI